jgi:hypothetical protein
MSCTCCCCCCWCQVEAAAKEVAKELVVGLEEGVATVGSSDTPAAAAATTAGHLGPAAGGLLALREAAGQLAARAERSLEVGLGELQGVWCSS